MKNFVKQLSVCLFLLVFISGAHAMNGGKHHDKGEQGHMLEKMQQHLQLTEAQVTQIREIQEASGVDLRQTMRGMMMSMMQLDPSSPDYEVALEQLAQQQAKQIEQQLIAFGRMQAKIHAVLTPEQQQKALEFHQGMSGRMDKLRERRGEMGGKPQR